MVDPNELVGVARSLASEAAPNDAALRRSVSSAYYALFHALAVFAMDRLVGDEASAASVLMYRGLDHKRIKDALEDVAKPTMRLAVRRAIGTSTISVELKTFADVFVPM